MTDDVKMSEEGQRILFVCLGEGQMANRLTDQSLECVGYQKVGGWVGVGDLSYLYKQVRKRGLALKASAFIAARLKQEHQGRNKND